MKNVLVAVVAIAFVVGLLWWSRRMTRRYRQLLDALAPHVEGAVVSPGAWLNGDGMRLVGRVDGRTIRSGLTRRGNRHPQIVTVHEVEVANALSGFTLRVADVVDLPRLLFGAGADRPRSIEVHVDGDAPSSERLFQATKARGALDRLLAVPGIGEVTFREDRISVEGWVEGETLLALFHALTDLARACERRRTVLPGREGQGPAFEWTDGAGSARCPYCHDPIVVQGEEADPCPRCRTIHHRACLEEAGGCTVLGCRPASERPRDKA